MSAELSPMHPVPARSGRSRSLGKETNENRHFPDATDFSISSSGRKINHFEHEFYTSSKLLRLPHCAHHFQIQSSLRIGLLISAPGKMLREELARIRACDFHCRFWSRSCVEQLNVDALEGLFLATNQNAPVVGAYLGGVPDTSRQNRPSTHAARSGSQPGEAVQNQC
jgi:hypothetical protein